MPYSTFPISGDGETEMVFDSTYVHRKTIMHTFPWKIRED